VREDPDKLNVIRTVLNQNVSSMSAARLDEVMQGLELLLHARGAYKVRVRDVRPQDDTGKIEQYFFAINNKKESSLMLHKIKYFNIY